MNPLRLLCVAFMLSTALCAAPGRADDSFAKVADDVNPKLVKLFGAGGLKGLAAYGTGMLVSPDGYILTVYSHILDTQDLRVHLYDGTRYHAKVVAIEPELDVALIRIGTDKDQLDGLPYFDVAAAAKRQLAEAGTGVLAFSNQFEIATRDEPVSVQQGSVAAYAKLHGKSGIHNASYTGDVYVIDAITNNPGAAGGAVTTRKGELLGIIGKELHNELTNTWINYAVPIGAKATIHLEDNVDKTVSIVDLVEQKEKYKPAPKRDKIVAGGYHGIVFVPKVVERTPAFVDEVEPNSPAATAGLKPDDLIVYVDGLPVTSVQVFEELLERYRPKETIKIEVRRGDRLSTLSLTLEPSKKKPAPAKKDGGE